MSSGQARTKSIRPARLDIIVVILDDHIIQEVYIPYKPFEIGYNINLEVAKALQADPAWRDSDFFFETFLLLN